MSDYDRNLGAPGLSAGGAIAIDAGLRAHMLRVYNYMTAGVGLTGAAAFLTYQFTGPELLQSPLMWVLILAPLGLVFFISARINTLRWGWTSASSRLISPASTMRSTNVWSRVSCARRPSRHK